MLRNRRHQQKLESVSRIDRRLVLAQRLFAQIDDPTANFRKCSEDKVILTQNLNSHFLVILKLFGLFLEFNYIK